MAAGSILAVKGTACQTQFALAHRFAGLGCVAVLMHTTNEALGPGQYTLITNNGYATIKYHHGKNALLPYLQSSSPGINSVHSYLDPVGAFWMWLTMPSK